MHKRSKYIYYILGVIIGEEKSIWFKYPKEIKFYSISYIICRYFCMNSLNIVFWQKNKYIKSFCFCRKCILILPFLNYTAKRHFCAEIPLIHPTQTSIKNTSTGQKTESWEFHCPIRNLNAYAMTVQNFVNDKCNFTEICAGFCIVFCVKSHAFFWRLIHSCTRALTWVAQR